MPAWLRRRIPFVGLALTAILAGLAVHVRGDALPPTLRDMLGDALWAAMLTAWIGAASPTTSLWRRGAIAMALCAAVELGQLYHTPTLDAIRRTAVGHLTLGSDYDTRDLAAYALGVLAVTLLEHGVRQRRGRAQRAEP